MKSALLLAVTAVGWLVGARAVLADSADPTFDELDKNHDGVLSKDEVAAMFPATNDSGGGQRGAGNGSGFGGGRGGLGGGGGFGAGGLGGGLGGGRAGHGGGMAQGTGATRSAKSPNIDEIFKSWDKDGNGTISREEFDARPHKGRRHGASSADDQRTPPTL